MFLVVSQAEKDNSINRVNSFILVKYTRERVSSKLPKYRVNGISVQ